MVARVDQNVRANAEQNSAFAMKLSATIHIMYGIYFSKRFSEKL